MNKLKFTNHNQLGQPQNVILTYADGKVEELYRWPHTKYYDSHDKQYNSLKKFAPIKNNTYV